MQTNVISTIEDLVDLLYSQNIHLAITQGKQSGYLANTRLLPGGGGLWLGGVCWKWSATRGNVTLLLSP